MSASTKHLQLLRHSGFTDNESAMVAMETKLETNDLLDGEMFLGTTTGGEVVLGASSGNGGSIFYNSNMTHNAIEEAKNAIIGDLIFV